MFIFILSLILICKVCLHYCFFKFTQIINTKLCVMYFECWFQSPSFLIYQTPQRDVQEHMGEEKKQRDEKMWLIFAREHKEKPINPRAINTSCQILAASSLNSLITWCFWCTRSFLHEQSMLHSPATDVEAAGASLCSGVLSLREAAAADGGETSSSRSQLWPRRAKPESADQHASRIRLTGRTQRGNLLSSFVSNVWFFLMNVLLIQSVPIEFLFWVPFVGNELLLLCERQKCFCLSSHVGSLQADLNLWQAGVEAD